MFCITASGWRTGPKRAACSHQHGIVLPVAKGFKRHDPQPFKIRRPTQARKRAQQPRKNRRAHSFPGCLRHQTVKVFIPQRPQFPNRLRLATHHRLCKNLKRHNRAVTPQNRSTPTDHLRLMPLDIDLDKTDPPQTLGRHNIVQPANLIFQRDLPARLHIRLHTRLHNPACTQILLVLHHRQPRRLIRQTKIMRGYRLPISICRQQRKDTGMWFKGMNLREIPGENTGVIANIRPNVQADTPLGNLRKDHRLKAAQLLQIEPTIKQDLLTNKIIQKNRHARANRTARTCHTAQVGFHNPTA